MAASVSPEQQALRDGVFQIAAAFGIGGTKWTRERTTGNGVTVATTPSTAPLTGYVVYVKPERLGTALPGAVVNSPVPVFYAAAGTDVQGGDLLTSAESGAVFAVIGAIPSAGYVAMSLEARS